MLSTTLLALGWPGISDMNLSPLGAVGSLVGAVILALLTVWLCGESVRQRAEQRQIDALAQDDTWSPVH
jgi:hypothetical protein